MQKQVKKDMIVSRYFSFYLFVVKIGYFRFKINTFKMKNKFTLLFCFLISFSGLIAQNISGESKVQSFNVQKVIVPPILVVKEGSIKFFDDDKNGRLDAYESASLSFVLQNIGKGPAFALRAVVNVLGEVSGLTIEKNQVLSTIKPGESQYITIPIEGTSYLTTGKVNLEIIVKEPNGLDCDPIQVGFNTLKFQEPKIELVDGVFSTDDGQNTFKKKIPAKLNIIVQNTGQSKTDRITVNVNSPSNVLALDSTLFNVGSLSAGESYSISFGFIATSNYNEDKVTFNVVAKEGFAKYGSSRDFSVVIDQKLDASKLVVQGKQFKATQIKKEYLTSDVDRDVPVNYNTISNRYALVIGNEDYSSFQTGLSSEVNVDYAINDAKVFSEYCQKTLGVDSRHLKLLTNATYGQMKQAIAWVQNLSDIEGGNAEIIFYYSGHGLPNEVTKEGYLMPVDVSGNNVSNGISLKYLYQELNKYPAKEITVVLDACFSGGARNEGLVAMKGVKIKPKEDVVSGNMVVFASSSGNESSAVYREKQHGYLTYFLLKKIQETKGYVNYKDLSDYLDYQVRKETAIIGKVQTPKVNVSPSARDQWKYWSFR